MASSSASRDLLTVPRPFPLRPFSRSLSLSLSLPLSLSLSPSPSLSLFPLFPAERSVVRQGASIQRSRAARVPPDASGTR